MGDLLAKMGGGPEVVPRENSKTRQMQKLWELWSGEADSNVGHFSFVVLAPTLVGELQGWKCFQSGF